jgi:protein ImuA
MSLSACNHAVDDLRLTCAPAKFGIARRPLPFGLSGLDSALQGGLAFGALHEIAPAAALHLGAALGFALTIAARIATDQHVLVLQTDFAAQDSGVPYGPGLEALGLTLQRLVLLRLPRPVDLLAAFEETLKSTAIAVVIGELPQAGPAADLTATRRLSLAAREGGGLALLLRHQPSLQPTAAVTRWEVAAAPSVPDRLGGLGRTAFALSLIKNRRGPCGRFTVCWDHHECRYVPPLSLAVAAPASDRPLNARAFGRVG